MKIINEEKINRSLETLGEGILSFSKDGLRAAIALVLFGAIGKGIFDIGKDYGGRKYERGQPVKYFYPKIAEVRVNENTLVIDNKYRLDYDPNLSTDPNTIIFTSYKYKQNNKK